VILFDETKPQGRPARRNRAEPGRLYTAMAGLSIGDRPRAELAPALFTTRPSWRWSFAFTVAAVTAVALVWWVL
jgi:hypothetical protein